MNPVLLALIVIGLSVLYAASGVAIVHKRMHGHVVEGHNDVLSPIFATAGVIYAVLLGFLVVVVWESYDNAKANIADEATHLTTAYRLTAGMRFPAERIAMRAALRRYTKAVIEDEWTRQALTGKASPDARAAVGNMYSAFHVMPLTQSGSQINGEFLRTLSAITVERNRRIIQAAESLPWIIWLGLVLGGAIVVGLTFVLYMETVWLHVVVSSVLAALIGTLLYLVIVLNRPFVGPMALTPEPFEYVNSFYDAVDQEK
jgi:hypothetical protein